jgi:diaminopimelate decarboxylase
VTTGTTALADLLGLLPPGSSADQDGELVVGGCRLADLAAAWGTPLYLIEEAAPGGLTA